MIYQLDLRLKEIKQREDLPFGGVSLILVGDLLQLAPVKGRYPFQTPFNKQFELAHLISPLWDLFKPIVLRKNHRQGDDKLFADILNRISRGQQTDQDLKLLSTKIKPKGDPTIPEDSVYIFSVNADVNEQYNYFLEKIEAELIISNAIIRHSTMKNFKPL